MIRRLEDATAQLRASEAAEAATATVEDPGPASDASPADGSLVAVPPAVVLSGDALPPEAAGVYFSEEAVVR